MKLYVDGIGLRGPGLPGWSESRDCLAGRHAYHAAEMVVAASALLPPAERRRTTDTVKLAMAVGSEAIAHAEVGAAETPSIFASSGGDGQTITAILTALATPAREVSPTRFHNSVHNAPAGYWTIATQCREASTSLCAHDFSFAAGLVEAGVRVLTEQRRVLLVAYDLPYPPALDACRPITAPFGTALVLSPQPTPLSKATLDVTLECDLGTETVLDDVELETLRAGIPAARALPLLAAIARGAEQRVVLPYVAGGGVVIEVAP